jgi:hypothetical protein
MIDNVYPFRNVYINKKGSSKIKLLTKNKKYKFFVSTEYRYFIICDDGRGYWFNRNLFRGVVDIRDNKLKELGIDG